LSLPEVYRGRAAGGTPEPKTFFELFVESFDTVLAPIHSCTEDIDLYLDPELCPTDYLPWLASWSGAVLNERWPVARQRELVMEAFELYGVRGTVGALRRMVELLFGVEPEIEDSGGITWSRNPAEPMSLGRPSVVVRLPADGPDGPLDQKLVERLVRDFVPAIAELDVQVGG
jgi:phage tail-like protein